MDSLCRVDWQRLFIPQMSLLEIVLRGVLVYLLLCFLLRVVLKRQAGKIALSDLLVLTLVTGVCRNPLVADAYSLPDGLGVVAVILGVSYLIDWWCFRSPFVHGLMHPKSILLIRDGLVLRDDLKRELLTKEQLSSKLRSHGLNDVARVAEAWLEGDGYVSVIRREDDGVRSQRHPHDSGSPNHDSAFSDAENSLDPKELWILARRLERALRLSAEAVNPIKNPP
jgi:uncharacterized membrane protein YcaP (DUF421 family)